ncbi:tRNA lysidine(34) synthetase TilS, partial [Myxococcota bacterium]|nr:tRNA lysidine(34) synthetase TilS [Myxococcota bacterium]
RGSWLYGAAGIPQKRDLYIRPLLQIHRDEILSYLSHFKISFATDPTNSDLNRSRARIRAEITPALTAINTKAIENINLFSETAREDDELLQKMSSVVYQRASGSLGSLHWPEVSQEPSPIRKRVLRSWLKTHKRAATRAEISKIEELVQEKKKRISIPGGDIAFEGKQLWPVDKSSYSCSVARSGNYSIAELPLNFQIQTLAFEGELKSYLEKHDGVKSVAFDADLLEKICPEVPLLIRPWKPGDRFRPYGRRDGRQGSTTVGDFFTNHKVPTPARMKWPLVLAGDEIIWVVGLRRSAFAPVTAESKRVLVINVDREVASRLH